MLTDTCYNLGQTTGRQKFDTRNDRQVQTAGRHRALHEFNAQEKKAQHYMSHTQHGSSQVEAGDRLLPLLTQHRFTKNVPGIPCY